MGTGGECVQGTLGETYTEALCITEPTSKPTKAPTTAQPTSNPTNPTNSPANNPVEMSNSHKTSFHIVDLMLFVSFYLLL